MTDRIGPQKFFVYRGIERYPDRCLDRIVRVTSYQQIVAEKVGQVLYRFDDGEVQLLACQKVRIDDDKIKLQPKLRIAINGQEPTDKETIDRLTRTALEEFLQMFLRNIPEVAHAASLEEGKGKLYILLKGYK